jgi:flagellar motor component MotA
MVTFNDFLAANPWNDLVVQRALGEIDSEVLATALANLPVEIHSIFYRNMSKRARELVSEQIGIKRRFHPSKIVAAQGLLTELLDKHAKKAEGEEPPGDMETLPDISAETQEAIVSTFRQLSIYIRKHGFLPLQELEASITNPLLRMGIELLVDGTDPFLIRSILEKYQETCLQQARATLSMIVEGIDALAERNLPQMVEMKLRAYMAQDWPKG